MLRRLDPLLIFVVLGGILAWAHIATREDAPQLLRDTEIVVTDADVAWLQQTFAKTWQRPPTNEELRTLVERRVRDEILFREARALGLDQGDDTLRRRLARTLEYLAKDATAVEPTDDELAVYFEANKARFAIPAARSFAHVYVNLDKRGAQADAEAKTLLNALKAAPEQDITELGDRIMLEQEQRGLAPRDVRALFGDDFAKALFDQPARTWVGPLRSGYGLHLVFVREDVPGEIPPLDTVRDRVRSDLVDKRREDGLNAYVEALRGKYDVRIDAALLEDRE